MHAYAAWIMHYDRSTYFTYYFYNQALCYLSQCPFKGDCFRNSDSGHSKHSIHQRHILEWSTVKVIIIST